MFGSFSSQFLKQTAKSNHFKKFVKDFFEQALVDETNDQMGWNVNTKPSGGGTFATILRKTLTSDSSKPGTTGGGKTKLPYFVPIRQSGAGNLGNDGDGLEIDEGQFQRVKSFSFQFPGISKTKKKSCKDELFAMMVSSACFFLNSIGMQWATDYYIARIRAYVDSLTEAEAAEQLAIWLERRNRDNI